MGIPDFYDWKPPNHPVFLMAGNGHMYITEVSFHPELLHELVS
jgi:hypothetical protein